MAVEARPLNHLFPCLPQLISNRCDFDVAAKLTSGMRLHDPTNAQMQYGALPPSTSSSRVQHHEVIFPAFYQSAEACDRILPVKSVDSGFIASDNSLLGAPRKRARDPVDYACGDALMMPRKSRLSPFLLDQDVALVIHQQQSEQERQIAQHIDTMRLEIEEKVRVQSKELLAAIQQRVVRATSEKDEEVRRVEKLNLALQERIKTLWVENQLLRGLAQMSEAAANSLRSDLQQVLAVAHATEDRHHFCSAVAAEEDDAQSCCGRQGAAEEEQTAAMAGCGSRASPSRLCRGCGEKESCVLLLPCRHLCLCAACGSTPHCCPVCDSVMTGTIHVNMLS